jgi:ABC-2 type transport system ATP-binding protein
MTLVVSSHILAELDEYSTDMLVLQKGRIVEQRGLRGAGPESTRRMRIELVAPDERLQALLASQPGVADVTVEGGRAEFAWSAGVAEQATLLRALVTAGLSVASFGEERENLHDSYLRTVKADRP